MLLLYHYFFIANFWRKCIRGISDINPFKQGSRSGSRNCGKKSKTHHFLEIVQYTCNTTFLYQNLIGNLKKQKMQISKYFSCYICFLWSCIDLKSKHKYLWKIHKMLFKFKFCHRGQSLPSLINIVKTSFCQVGSHMVCRIHEWQLFGHMYIWFKSCRPKHPFLIKTTHKFGVKKRHCLNLN